MSRNTKDIRAVIYSPYPSWGILLLRVANFGECSSESNPFLCLGGRQSKLNELEFDL